MKDYSWVFVMGMILAVILAANELLKSDIGLEFKNPNLICFTSFAQQ